jgi:hypothetical protein
MENILEENRDTMVYEMWFVRNKIISHDDKTEFTQLIN